MTPVVVEVGPVTVRGPGTPPAGYDSLGVTAPFTRVRFDFVMQPALDEREADARARMARAVA